jgi:hypothetical protein
MTVAEPVVATQQNYDRAGARVQLRGMDSNTIGVGITASSASVQNPSTVLSTSLPFRRSRMTTSPFNNRTASSLLSKALCDQVEPSSAFWAWATVPPQVSV